MNAEKIRLDRLYKQKISWKHLFWYIWHPFRMQSDTLKNISNKSWSWSDIRYTWRRRNLQHEAPTDSFGRFYIHLCTSYLYATFGRRIETLIMYLILKWNKFNFVVISFINLNLLKVLLVFSEVKYRTVIGHYIGRYIKLISRELSFPVNFVDGLS